MSSVKGTVLVIDDEQDIRESLKELLEDEGYAVTVAGSVVDARKVVLAKIDTVLLDIRLGDGDGDGIELLSELKSQRPDLPVIMITGHGSVDLAVEAFRRGAYEFLEKPLRLMQVRACVRNSVESMRLKAERQSGRVRPLYRSTVMKDLFSQISRLAGLTTPVMILGPSGSGKELAAQALHYDGTRSERPFVAVNAASLPANLAEDELFGHQKGAFTGADSARKGALAQADGGTLFLDEIADLDLTVQAKLLRVLETGRFAPLGSEKEVQVDVRIVAATHKNMDQLMAEGKFRHDLWYRLAAFVVTIPSLADRREDISLLAEAFLELISAEIGAERQFSPEVLQQISELPLEGNVRELRHLVNRMAVMANSVTLTLADLNLATTPAKQTPQNCVNYSTLEFRHARVAFEMDYFKEVLDRYDGNITASAAAIGMAQSNLSRKLKELGLR